MLQCVVNVSEGRDATVVDALGAAAGSLLLDVHSDPVHNRSVLTLAGPAGPLRRATEEVARAAVSLIDLRHHAGVHPRLGAIDVVPFVPLGDATMDDASAARSQFVAWAVADLGVPCFFYGPERPLPAVRKQAFGTLLPDAGPPEPHPTAGAICVGVRPILVAYNVVLAPGTSAAVARRVAAAVRSRSVRALGLDLGGRSQVSMNLVEPHSFGPAQAYDAVAALVPVEQAELVGLVPAAVLEAVPPERWAQLALSAERTIEVRLANRSGP